MPRGVTLRYNLAAGLTIPDAGTYTATDYDDGDTFTWDLDGVDADHFNIGVTSGVLTFKLRPDYERPVDSDDDNTYDIIVQATDEHMYTENSPSPSGLPLSTKYRRSVTVRPP